MKNPKIIIAVSLILIGIAITLTILGPRGLQTSRYRRREYIPKLFRNTPKIITVTGMDFPQGGEIPPTYTCDGINVNPGIKWNNLPENTASLAILIYDVDSPYDYFIHWMIVNIPPATTQIPSGYEITKAIPGRNDFGSIGYGGPCPPAGEQHKYIVIVIALNNKIDLKPGFSFEDFYNTIKNHIIAYGETYFYYSRT